MHKVTQAVHLRNPKNISGTIQHPLYNTFCHKPIKEIRYWTDIPQFCTCDSCALRFGDLEGAK
jgi:hypothetical protein